MDRFIVLSLSSLLTPDNTLKSNMDRFIEVNQANGFKISPSLKSNMDRFIVWQAECYY